MSSVHQKRLHILLALAIMVSFSIASLFGAHLTMASDAHGMMPNCTETVCPMSVSSHINGWQQLFLVVFEKSGLLALFAAISLLAGFAVLKYFKALTALQLISIRTDQERGSPPSNAQGNYLFSVIGSGIVHKRE